MRLGVLLGFHCVFLEPKSKAKNSPLGFFLRAILGSRPGKGFGRVKSCFSPRQQLDSTSSTYMYIHTYTYRCNRIGVRGKEGVGVPRDHPLPTAHHTPHTTHRPPPPSPPSTAHPPTNPSINSPTDTSTHHQTKQSPPDRRATARTTMDQSRSRPHPLPENVHINTGMHT